VKVKYTIKWIFNNFMLLLKHELYVYSLQLNQISWFSFWRTLLRFY